MRHAAQEAMVLAGHGQCRKKQKKDLPGLYPTAAVLQGKETREVFRASHQIKAVTMASASDLAPVLAGGKSAQPIIDRLRKLGVDEEIRVLQDMPVGDQYARQSIDKNQQAFFNCVATTGYALVDTQGNFIFDRNVCLDADLDSQPENTRETASRYISMINVYMPQLNAGIVWARRNYIFEHLVVPVVKKADAVAKKTQLGDTESSAWYIMNNVRFGLATAKAEDALGLINSEGYHDLDLADRATVYWVPFFPHKGNNRRMNPVERKAFRAKIGEAKPMAGTPDAEGVDAQNFDSMAYWSMIRAMPSSDKIDQAGVLTKDLNGRGEVAKFIVESFKASVNKDTKAHFDVLQAINDKSERQTNEVYGMYARVFSRNYNSFIKNVNASPGKANRILGAPESKPAATNEFETALWEFSQLERVARQSSMEYFNVEFRDVDIEVPVVSGIELLFVSRPIEEGKFTVYPTRLFAWSDKLEDLAVKVQKYVNREGQNAFRERLKEIAMENNGFVEQLRTMKVEEGGLKNTGETDLDTQIDLTLDQIEYCLGISRNYPNIRSKDELKDKGENLKLGNVSGDAQTHCETEPKSDGKLHVMSKIVHKNVFGDKDELGRAPIDREPDMAMASFYHDMAQKSNKEGKKKLERRAYAFGEK
jgi:hypothetical protein